jgi:hypothetical protein
LAAFEVIADTFFQLSGIRTLRMEIAVISFVGKDFCKRV